MRLLGENVRALVVRDSGIADGVYRPEPSLMQFGARVFQFLGERNFAILKKSPDEWVLTDLGRKFNLRNPMAETLFTALSVSLAPPEFGWSGQVASTAALKPRLLLYFGQLLEDQEPDSIIAEETVVESSSNGCGNSSGSGSTKWKNIGGLRVFTISTDITSQTSLGLELAAGRRIVKSEGPHGVMAKWNASCLIDSAKIRASDVLFGIDGKILSDADLIDPNKPSLEMTGTQTARKLTLEIAREEKLIWRGKVHAPVPEIIVSGTTAIICVEWERIPHARGFCLAASDDGGRSWWPMTGEGDLMKHGKCGAVLDPARNRVYIDSARFFGERAFRFSVAAVFWRQGKYFSSPFSLASSEVKQRGSAATTPPEISPSEASKAPQVEQLWFLLPSEFEEGYSLPEIVADEYEVTLALAMTRGDIGKPLGVTHLREADNFVQVLDLDLSQDTLLGRWNAAYAATDYEIRKYDKIVKINEETKIAKVAKMLESYKQPLPEPAIKRIILRRAVNRTYLEKIRIQKNTALLSDARRLVNAITRCSARNFFLYRHCGPPRLRSFLPEWLKFDPEVLEERISLVQKLQPLICSDNVPAFKNALDVLHRTHADSGLSDLFDTAEQAYRARLEKQKRAYVLSSIKYIDRCDWRNLHEAKDVLERAKEISDHESVSYLESVIKRWEKDKERIIVKNELDKYLDPNKKLRINPSVLEFAFKDANLRDHLGQDCLDQLKELLRRQEAQEVLVLEMNKWRETQGSVDAVEEALIKVKKLGGASAEAEELIRTAWAVTEIRRSIQFSLRHHPLTSGANYRTRIKKIKEAELFYKTNFDQVIDYVTAEFQRIKNEAFLNFRSAVDLADPQAIVLCLTKLSDLEVPVPEELSREADKIVNNHKRFHLINDDLIQVSRSDDPKAILSVVQRAEKFEEESKLSLPHLSHARTALNVLTAVASLQEGLTHNLSVDVIRERLAVCQRFSATSLSERSAEIVAKAKDMVVRDEKRKRALSPEEEQKAELIRRALRSTHGDYIKMEFLRLAINETQQDLEDTEIFHQALEQFNQLRHRLLA